MFECWSCIVNKMTERRSVGSPGEREDCMVQNVNAALRLADHVYVLAEGDLQFDGPPADLSDEDELMELYLGIG